MDKNDKSSESNKVMCEVCLKEIPRSEAKIDEVNDYVLYFCGLDCYDKWQSDNKKDE